MSDPFVLAGVALSVLGLIVVGTRRSMITGLAGLALGLIGVALVFVAGAYAHHDAGGFARAALVVFAIIVLIPVGASVAVAAYRQKGTVNVDEMRELRG